MGHAHAANKGEQGVRDSAGAGSLAGWPLRCTDCTGPFTPASKQSASQPGSSGVNQPAPPRQAASQTENKPASQPGARPPAHPTQGLATQDASSCCRYHTAGCAPLRPPFNLELPHLSILLVVPTSTQTFDSSPFTTPFLSLSLSTPFTPCEYTLLSYMLACMRLAAPARVVYTPLESVSLC